MISNLEKLFDEITEHVKKNHLSTASHLLEHYCGNDWKKYLCECDCSHSITCQKQTIYHKILVKINDIVEMFVIKWGKSAESCIHDHPDDGCIVKILDGTLREDVYEKECDDKINFLSTNVLKTNDIGYRESNKILHKITNINDKESVSLHIYSKPNYKHNVYS